MPRTYLIFGDIEGKLDVLLQAESHQTPGLIFWIEASHAPRLAKAAGLDVGSHRSRQSTPRPPQ